MKLFLKYLIVNIIWPSAPLKIRINEELRKTTIRINITNKNKTICIKNDILNDFLSGMVDKHLICFFFTIPYIKIVNSNSCTK